MLLFPPIRTRIGRLAGLLAIAAFLSPAASAGAASPVAPPGGRTVLAEAGEVVRGDRYAIADTVVVDGTIEGDVFVLGNRVLVAGRVTGDLIGAGDTLQVSGRVDGDVRFLGQSVTVEGAVGGGLTASVARRVWVARQGRVGGTLMALAQGVVVDGEVGRDLRAATQQVAVAGRVARDVQVRAESLRALDGGEVGGTLEVWGPAPPEIGTAARVSEVRFHPVAPPRRQLVSTFDLLRFIGFVLFGGLLGWIWPRFGDRARRTLERHGGLAFGIGVALVFGVPALVAMMTISVVGLPPALLVVAPAYLASLYLGQLALARAAAAWARDRFGLRGRPAAGVAFVGAALAGAIAVRLPWIGPLVAFALVCAGLGLVALTFRPPRSPAEPPRAQPPEGEPDGAA